MAAGSLSRGDDPRFVWVGPAYDASGHADELRGFLRAQELAGDAPALESVTWTKATVDLSPGDRQMLRRQAERLRRRNDLAVHTYLPHLDNPTVNNAVNVARAMFETDRVPSDWIAPLLERDEVWVPCRHNFEAFADSGIPASKMRIVGGTLDFDLFAPEAEPYPLDLGDDRFVFLTNFDFSARKGWDVLLRAWGQAFSADDPVCLVLKTGSFYREDGYVEDRIASFIRQEFGAGTDLAPVHLLTDVLSAEDMPRLYAAADAYVLASRGEGWGRPYMEAQAMGLPTIASSWGGQREFMDEDTSWLVDGTLVDVPYDAEVLNDLYRGHRWFEPAADDLAAKMREITSGWDTARARAAGARERLIARFGAQATADTLRDAGRAAAQRYSNPTRPACVVRGQFGSTASLATVNDGLSAGLENGGLTVHHRATGRPALKAALPGISHSWPHDFSPVSQGPSVIVVPWEYGAPPAEWVRSARARADRVWVPSDYVREQFVAAGMPPAIVEVVPNGFDPQRFSPGGPARALPTHASCKFLFVGGTIWRKGIDLLLAAWVEAFGPDDDVALVIKDFGTSTWYRGQNRQSELREYAERTDIAPIVYLDEDVPARELGALYRAADVLVAPYRGEGFCLPALEAMACGLPVIHTGTGPTSEFVPDAAGWALPAQRVAIPDNFDLPEPAGEAFVQEVDHAGLVKTLRDAASDAEGRTTRGRAAVAASKRYTWTSVADRARQSLHTLMNEGLTPVRLAQPELVERRPDATLVAYAPDWQDEARWAATLKLWSRSFTEDHPVTLGLHCADNDPDELAERILAQLEWDGEGKDSTADLMLCQPRIQLEDLVVAADAVLVDECDRSRPELVRRALRLVSANQAAIDELRAALPEPVAPAHQRAA